VAATVLADPGGPRDESRRRDPARRLRRRVPAGQGQL